MAPPPIHPNYKSGGTFEFDAPVALSPARGGIPTGSAGGLSASFGRSGSASELLQEKYRVKVCERPLSTWAQLRLGEPQFVWPCRRRQASWRPLVCPVCQSLQPPHRCMH